MGKDILKTVYLQLVAIHRSYKLVHFDLMMLLYLVVYGIVSFVVWLLDPDVKGLSDALWFTFQTGTTIGYGDLIVNNWFARILTVFFSIYSMVMVAIFTGIIAGYFVEVIKTEAKESAIKFLLDLERLPEMSKEELIELSARAKRFLKVQ
ncbi:MAG: two pore domain potassium channel family protein [Candidatus Methanomethylophilaceae archaeon]|nr:two pore domain potassium channel family protein [Candidatus Methanomethylophilaceae archaeon]